MRHFLLHKVSLQFIFIFSTLLGWHITSAAHDTWLMPARFLQNVHPGVETATLLPGTGDFFPKPDFLTPSDRIQTLICTEANAPIQAALEDHKKLGFQVKVKLNQADAPASCVVKLEREFIELEAAKVDLYLDDIQAQPAIRKHWAAMQAKNIPWREHYTKIARAELRASLSNQPTVDNKQVLPAELMAVHSNQELKVGTSAQFKLLHRGKPLAGQPIQWISGQQGQRGWLRSDSKGLVSVPLIEPGAWMLRGTIIRPGKLGEFESDFFTLVFLVPESAR